MLAFFNNSVCKNPFPGYVLRMDNRCVPLWAIGALILCLATVACSNDQPIRIGFSGQVTGAKSDIGVQGRNGAALAVEEINAAGGVNGRKLELLAEDDMDTPDGAVHADETLLRKGVVAIVGHMTTSQTLAAYPVVEKQGGILISPTTAAPALEGKQDGFFRVIPSNTKWAEAMAEYALKKSLKNAFFVGDADNVGYTDTFLASLDKSYTDQGGRFVGSRLYSSRAGEDWGRLAQAIRTARPDALMVCMAARDLVALAQALRPNEAGITVLGPPWPATSALVLSGGSVVEGFRFISNYSEDNAFPGFPRFQERYFKRFGWKPNFAAAFSFEAVVLLADALKRTGGNAQGLKTALADSSPHTGVIGPFTMSPDGDVIRPTFITHVKRGRFVITDSVGGPH